VVSKVLGASMKRSFEGGVKRERGKKNYKAPRKVPRKLRRRKSVRGGLAKRMERGDGRNDFCLPNEKI